MARRNTNSAKANKEVGQASSGNVPSFDEKALSALTSKIEKGFGAGKAQQQGEANRGHQSSNKLSGQRSSKAYSKTAPMEFARGTKRDIRGNAKAAVRGTSSVEGKNGKGNGDRAALLKEILALGGTEEDLDLVVDAVSDEEDASSNAALLDKSFRKELASFVAGLGIEGEPAEAGSGDDDKGDIHDDWEDASEVDGSTALDGEAMSTLHKPLSENPKHLVSIVSAGAIDLTNSR
jgi:ribosome biogenesis protein MAK21